MDAQTLAVITAEVGEEQATRIAEALKDVQTDPAVGTVRRNPATGDVAVHVRQYGQTYWRVVSVDDRNWVETEPIVGWDDLYVEAAEAKPAKTAKK